MLHLDYSVGYDTVWSSRRLTDISKESIVYVIFGYIYAGLPGDGGSKRRGHHFKAFYENPKSHVIHIM